MQVERKTLDVLCADLIRAKEAEHQANESRIEVEREIIALVGLPDEGAKTVDADGFKVKVTQDIRRKLDEKKYALIAEQIPEAIRPVKLVEELKIEAAGVRWLKENEPGYYKLFCSAMTETPSKPSVKVEVAT